MKKFIALFFAFTVVGSLSVSPLTGEMQEQENQSPSVMESSSDSSADFTQDQPSQAPTRMDVQTAPEMKSSEPTIETNLDAKTNLDQREASVDASTKVETNMNLNRDRDSFKNNMNRDRIKEIDRDSFTNKDEVTPLSDDSSTEIEEETDTPAVEDDSDSSVDVKVDNNRGGKGRDRDSVEDDMRRREGKGHGHGHGKGHGHRDHKDDRSFWEVYFGPAEAVYEEQIEVEVIPIEGEPVEAEEQPVEEKQPDVLSVIEDNEDLSMFEEAIHAAELTPALTGAGPFTIFAPSNEAFEELGDTFEDLKQPENKEELRLILLSHVIPEKMMSEDLDQNDDVKASKGMVDIESDDGNIQFGDANVIEADIEASNGVIHVIDKVVIK